MGDHFQAGKPMALIGFKNTHNQPVYINPALVLYVTTFEEDVSIIALAVAGTGGNPLTIYVRGSVDQIRLKIDGPPAPR
jgi:hypothetical protein